MPVFEDVLMRPQDRAFYDHPFIQSISQTPKWSISDKNKRPLSYYWACRNQVRGCSPKNDQDMATLDQWVNLFTDKDTNRLLLNNHAFYLNAPWDKFIIIDIEAICPVHLRQKFLSLPYIFGQKSRSGKGLHLIFPLTDDLIADPLMANLWTRDRVPHPKKYYEILITHWATFTRQLIPPFQGDITNQTPFVNFLKKVAAGIKPLEHLDYISCKKEDLADIPNIHIILDLIGPVTYDKIPQDFNNDLSAWEYGYTSILAQALFKALANPQVKNLGHAYTQNEIINILYYIMEQNIPYRPKHAGQRNNQPYLLNEARKFISRKSQRKD